MKDSVLLYCGSSVRLFRKSVTAFQNNDPYLGIYRLNDKMSGIYSKIDQDKARLTKMLTVEAWKCI